MASTPLEACKNQKEEYFFSVLNWDNIHLLFPSDFGFISLVLLVFRPLDSNRNYTIRYPGSSASWMQTVGLSSSITLCLCVHIKLTLEQQGFELDRSTYTWIYFNNYVLWDYTIPVFSSLQMWDCGFREMIEKFYANFGLCTGCMPLIPACSRVNCIFLWFYFFGESRLKQILLD